MVSKLFQYEKQQRVWYYQLSWFSAWITLATKRSENSHVGVTNITGIKVLSTDIPVSSTEATLPSYQTASSNPLGVYSLIKAIYVCAAPKGRGFAPFLSENGYRLCPFWSGFGYGNRANYGIVWTYSSFQFQMRWKEREIFEFEIEFKKCFCSCSNLSDDEIISWRLGLKTGWKLRFSTIPRNTPSPRGSSLRGSFLY